MNKQTDRKNASFAYSANMLRTLMDMKLITAEYPPSRMNSLTAMKIR